MSRLLLFLVTLGALAALVMVFLAAGLTAAVATASVLALAAGATTIVLQLGDNEPGVEAAPDKSQPARPRPVQHIAGPTADNEPDE